MQTLPEPIKKELINFLTDLPVEKHSKDWQAIQVAIAMILTPGSFKKGVHVYMDSCDESRDPGCYNISSMSVKIWPHKVQLRRTHKEYVSGTDIDINQTIRYIYPSKKYSHNHFYEVMSDYGQLFSSNYSQCESDPAGSYSILANFHIETNCKL